eukprot:TRINITY_DN18546_c0_g1_i1.p1 TRINITY_DN18546_c0_g1~~TRINITY_DN18546_c0_g1_i1.p1  ORF type:complete len:145 (-),score=20.64 TRINITY_DN18546_c0_g1_i1:93-527(-)
MTQWVHVAKKNTLATVFAVDPSTVMCSNRQFVHEDAERAGAAFFLGAKIDVIFKFFNVKSFCVFVPRTKSVRSFFHNISELGPSPYTVREKGVDARVKVRVDEMIYDPGGIYNDPPRTLEATKRAPRARLKAAVSSVVPSPLAP